MSGVQTDSARGAVLRRLRGDGGTDPAGRRDARGDAGRPIWDKADQIKEVEHKCDFLTHEIIQRLHRTFVTLDREDIHDLARSLDDVMDAIDDSAAVVRLYSIERVRPDARELVRIIKASTDEMVKALKALERRNGVAERR